MKFDGPGSNLTSYTTQYPGYNGKNPYVTVFYYISLEWIQNLVEEELNLDQQVLMEDNFSIEIQVEYNHSRNKII